MFHVFTRCDTVSFLVVEVKKCMHGKLGKHIQMSLQYSVLWLQDQHWQPLTQMERVEKFVDLLCDCISSQVSVNDARMQLFTQRGRTIDAWMPPTKAALEQRIMRAAYPVRTKHCCMGLKQQLLLQSYHYAPSEWGWNKSTDGGCMGSSLDNSTRGYTSLQRTDMMWLQERLQRMLQVSESYSQVHCTLLLWCNDWF